MLISYIQARVFAPGVIRLQATGPAFPLGYASGNIKTESATIQRLIQERSFVPSMRATTGKLYAPLGVLDSDQTICLLDPDTGYEDRVLFSMKEVLSVLKAPVPAYDASDKDLVEAHVKVTLNTAKAGPLKPNLEVEDKDPAVYDNEDNDNDEEDPVSIALMGLQQAVSVLASALKQKK